MLYILTILTALLCTSRAHSQEVQLSYSTEPYFGCRSLTRLFTIVHMWEHYGMDVAVEAAVRLPGSGRCGVLDLVDGTVGQPVSPVLKLTDMNGVTTSAVIRQIMYREVLVFYIDQ